MMRTRLLMLLAIVLLAPATATAETPNIVFILADDMGYGDPGCNNPESKTPTPNIDRLAADGVRFTDAHAPGALCVPSRYGLLTGRHPMRARLRPGREACIEEDRLTLASMLRARGYRTAMIGKWHLGFDDARDHDWTEPATGGPVDRGFDTYFGIPASLDIPPYFYVRDRTAVAAPTDTIAASATDGWSPIQGAFWRAGGVAPGFDHAQVLPRLTDEAVSVIDEHRVDDGPLFLYVALPAPHTPWLPLPPYRGQTDAGMYGDFVLQVDDTVGRILGALDRRGLRDDTLVVFSSDNGPVWYDADEARFGHRSTGLLRGMKADAWEGGHRVPFVARWPGAIPADSVSHQTLCLTDMMATFASIVGTSLPPDAGEDSYDMLPALRGATAPVRDVTLHKKGATAIRAGRWKLITHLGSGGFSKPGRVDPAPGGPGGQLYDLDADPGETNNRWSDEPAVVARLEARLERARAQPRLAPRHGGTNFIVILADDLGYGDLSVYDGWVATPHLERMAAEGITFTDFHTSGVVCSPTRAGLVTGRYQQRAGIPAVINADPKLATHRVGLQAEEHTFAELLGSAGYRTAIFGKWHLGYLPKHNPVHHGFERFRGFVSGNVDYASHFDRMGTHDWWDDDERVPEAGYLTHLITEHAVRFIDERAGEPFCLYVPHGAVHTPIQATGDPAMRGPDTGTIERRRRQTVRLMTTALDESVGAILDAVERNGLASRTLVLFLSDNGGAAHMRNDPLRGRKGTLFEGGHRVPALAWWPGRVEPGTRTDALCSSLDVMPTMLDLAGVAAPLDRPLDGVSLSPVLFDGAAPPRRLFWNGKAMRDGDWKLVFRPKEGTAPMLFDLSVDLAEQNDLAAEHPERVEAMLAALAAWRDDVHAHATPQPDVRPAD
jgi:arylsulfatase A-like enzyme